jgi:predicted dehydrogenase
VSSLPRVAVLGAGRIARMFHLRVLARLGAEVVAVADPDPEARRLAATDAPMAQLHTSWEDAIAQPDVEAVVVCLPTHLHVLAACAAFAAGKHVYVEKPLAPELDGAEEVATAWRAAGTVGMVGLNFRFQPLVVDARRRVAAGQLGHVVAVRSLVASAPRDLPDWKQDRATGGGALLDLAVHHLDVVPFLLDDPITTVAATLRTVRTVDDTATLTLGMRSGLTTQVLASATTRQADRIELLGDEQTLTVDRYASDRVELAAVQQASDRAGRARATRSELAGATRRARSTLAPRDEPSFPASIGAFLRAASSGVQVAPSIADGVRVAAVVDAAERSAADAGAPVTVTTDR